VVNNALDAVSELASETQAAAEAIETLGNDIEGIGSVIDVIRGVAEQTNLLALNAAIEAARAGEQGRGFAVVADEVRTLASRTQESTEQIQSKVESLQVDAQRAVATMLKNRQSADATIELTGKAGASLESITQSVERITDMSQQIASAAEEQSSVAHMVSENLVTVTQLAQTTDESTQQVFANTKGLNDYVSTLRGYVGRFKV
jgi:methyl-accepting chemotaxis protein